MIKILYITLLLLFIMILETYQNSKKNLFKINNTILQNNIDIYLFPSSMFSNKIYSFNNILNTKGNVINVEYPSTKFNLDKFAENIYNKIIKNNKKCILVGYSFGSLMCNIINSKFRNNNLLKKILCISNSCNGQVTDKAINIYKEMSQVKSEDEKYKLIYKLLFPNNFNINNDIKKSIRNNQLSVKLQTSIGYGIRKWIQTNNRLCSNNNNIKIFIIHGSKDIVYKLVNNENTTVVNNVGHGIVFQIPNLINQWIENNI